MHHRRSQGDSRSTSSIYNATSSIPATNNSSSSTSTTGRVSIYSMRERVILNKMTTIMGKLAPDTETEVTSRLHQEIPAIRIDGHLTYCFYIAVQNLIHLNATFILLYHTVFWFLASSVQKDGAMMSRTLQQAKDEHSQSTTFTNDYYPGSSQAINTQFINQYIYGSLVGIGFIEAICAFIWTLRKKLPFLIQKNQKLRARLSKLLIVMMFVLYTSFITWLVFHTFVTHQLSLIIFSLLVGHMIILTLLDKYNLFQESPYSLSKQSTAARKHYRHSTSSSSTSSIAANSLNRLSYRSSSVLPQRRPNSMVNLSSLSSTSTSTTTSVPISWSRWSSVTEEKLGVHECSTLYVQARQEANDLWPIVIRRILLTIYRTLASFALFDLIPIMTMDVRVRTIENQPIKMLILIFALSTLITHSSFLFPVKLQTTLQRIATHLGQWRHQPNIRTDTNSEWSSECNSYTRGSVVKLPSNNQYYIAVQHLSNAADPQSKSHSTLYRLFGDPTYLLTMQFLLCIVLVTLHIIWISRGKHWEQILIGYLSIFHSSYPVFKIVRDRVIMDFVEEHEVSQASIVSKQKKSN